MKRVHITGCPRSGTTLMTELMRIGFQFDDFCQHEQSIFTQPEGHPDLFLSKKPSDIKRIRPLLKADLNLFTIYMVRDPRSVITSMHKNFPGKYFCNFRIWNDCDKVARTLLDHPRFLQIRYEDLVQDPDRIQDQIQAKFPFLIKMHSFTEYRKMAKPSKDAHMALGGVREISSEKISTWKKFLPRVMYEISANPEMIKILISKGYEENSKWTSILEGIHPQKGQCRYPDKQSFFRKLESRIRHWIQIRLYILRL